MLRVLVAAAACLALHHAPADAHARDLDFRSKSSEFGELGTLIHAVKDQFKAVIEEIFLHVVEYIKTLCHQLKVKLMKKLGKWTLSDVFHSVFDGVTDFVIASSPGDDVFVSSSTAPPAPARPNSYYYRRNPYDYSSTLVHFLESEEEK